MNISSIPERISDSNQTPSRRARTLTILSLVMFIVYTCYLFYLQIIRLNEYRNRAANIARQSTVISTQRGEIYDRNYATPFVINTDSFAVDLIPAELPAERREAVFASLSTKLGMSIDEIKKKIPPSTYHLYQAIEIRNAVPYETVTAIAERIEDFPGVVWHSKPVRNYVETGSLSHILGYVGDITKDELKVLYNQGYKTGDIIGKAGVEKQYDSLLRGKDGIQYKTVDVKGKQVSSKLTDIVPPVMGSNLVLTIDTEIQRLAEKALGQRMGSVVVLKPATGEILAMVSYPWYDSNLFTGQEYSTAYARMLADPKSPLINRAIQSSYPPASTFKAIVTAGILEEKSFPPDKTVLCTGQVAYGDRVFHCHVKTGHGRLDLAGALAESCDIYYWTVGRDNLGIERIVAYAKDFGYGKITGIDLPGENEGFVPTPQWKERKYHEKWLGGDTMNMAVGQGDLLVTPLQMANTIAMIVNDGIVYRPHILKEVRDPLSGALVKTIVPEEIIRSRTSKETFSTLRDYLRGVITDGTARFPVSTKAVAVAGKTGTAEVGIKDRWHSWFAAYAPYKAENPQDVVVVVVMVEASNPWEWWAPYASNVIFQGIFAHQDYETAIDKLGFRYLVNKPQGRME